MQFKRIYVQNSGTAFEENVSDLTSVTDLSVQLVNAGETQPTNGAAPGSTINTSADVGNTLDITDYDAVRLLFRDSDVGAAIDQSPVIPTSDLEITALGYSAPQQQVTEITIPNPSVDDRWTVKVTDLEKGNQPFPRRSYEVEVNSGDSAADVATKFADAINQAEDSINDYDGSSVTASTNTDVLVLTAKDVGDIFDVATRNFDASDISITTNPTDGVGTPEQVRKYEQDDRGTVGRYVQSTNLLGSLPGPKEYVQSNGEYKLHTFSFPGDSEKAVNKSIDPQTYIVALESAVVANATEANGDAGVDDYLEFFDPLVVASG